MALTTSERACSQLRPLNAVYINWRMLQKHAKTEVEQRREVATSDTKASWEPQTSNKFFSWPQIPSIAQLFTLQNSSKDEKQLKLMLLTHRVSLQILFHCSSRKTLSSVDNWKILEENRWTLAIAPQRETPQSEISHGEEFCFERKLHVCNVHDVNCNCGLSLFFASRFRN